MKPGPLDMRMDPSQGLSAQELLQQITRPFVQLAGWVTPRVVLERHRPLVAFLILGFVWLAATAAKIAHCLEIGVQLCR